MKHSFLVGGLLTLLMTASGFGQSIAFEDFDSDSNLLSFTTSANVPAGGFTNAGDAFQEYTRLVDTSFPFNIADDSVTGSDGGAPFAGDTNGFLGSDFDNNTIFGITDTWNGDTNFGEEVTGTWSFDISSATAPLVVNIDMVAMNDYAGSTVNSNVDFFYQIDGGGYQALFTSSIATGTTRDYTMDNGLVVTYDDPLNMTSNTGTVYELNDNLQTLLANVDGLGNQLDIQVRVNMDGSESFGLDNIRISTIPEPTSATLLLVGLGALALRRRRK